MSQSCQWWARAQLSLKSAFLAASLNPQPRDVRAAPGGMGKAGAMGSYQLTPGLRGAACTCENAAWKLLCSQLRKTREIRDWNVELLLQDCSET